MGQHAKSENANRSRENVRPEVECGEFHGVAVRVGSSGWVEEGAEERERERDDSSRDSEFGREGKGKGEHQLCLPTG